MRLINKKNFFINKKFNFINKKKTKNKEKIIVFTILFKGKKKLISNPRKVARIKPNIITDDNSDIKFSSLNFGLYKKLPKTKVIIRAKSE